MINTKGNYKVKNRSGGKVTYTVQYGGNKIHQVFNPGETKIVPYEELRQLSYQHGGPELIYNYLQVSEQQVLNSFNLSPEPEYYMSEKQIIKLMEEGTLDEFLDCLDFAPIGVIDLIKRYAVALPLSDYNKRKAIKDKLGYDVDAAIKNEQATKNAEKEAEEATTPTRRVTKPVEQETIAEGPVRRTKPKYTIPNQQ